MLLLIFFLISSKGHILTLFEINRQVPQWLTLWLVYAEILFHAAYSCWYSLCYYVNQPYMSLITCYSKCL